MDEFSINIEEKKEDVVEKQFDKLNEAVVRVTAAKASVVFSYMTPEEADDEFGDKKQEEFYYVDLKYSLKNASGREITYRNRFACITYCETIPVYIKDLKPVQESDETEKLCQTEQELHDFLMKIIDRESFKRPLRRAKYGITNVEDV
jgi:hypothetical protein